MKKRKIYEISVIDKTYSKNISDETKFYTSDTALELGFELKETEYNFESAEIVLLNIDDRSLVTRPVAKVLDSFAYELEDDIIAHYGEWHGQLRFEQTGETYVSSPVKFRIENDLSNDRPPQLSDVQSWVSLKRYADGLVDELKQAVLEVEGMDATFQANEQSRQTTFETNESERDETFNTNETTRQAQELEREKAETKRQSVFDNNEASRNETFNANEVTRQENETTRQQAESQRQSTFERNETERQSAELIRVENEGQRKIDHANRSAELAGKADKVVLKNIVENGDFSNGLNGWGITEQNYTTADKVLTVTISYLSKYTRLFKVFEGNGTGDVMYASFKIKPKYASESGIRNGDTDYGITKTVPNLWNRISTVLEENVDKIRVYWFYHDTRTQYVQGDTIQYTEPIILNLTQIFGVSNEPTKDEMDELVKVTGYIDGDYALNNKEMLIWTLALIRRNRNAIITLGGTI